jgi:hypothetical protein
MIAIQNEFFVMQFVALHANAMNNRAQKKTNEVLK